MKLIKGIKLADLLSSYDFAVKFNMISELLQKFISKNHLNQ